MSKESEYEVSLPVALSSFFSAVKKALVLHFLLQLCWVTCRKGIMPDVEIYTIMFDRYCKEGMVSRAKSIIASMVQLLVLIVCKIKWKTPRKCLI